jgi:hypothetical protein
VTFLATAETLIGVVRCTIPHRSIAGWILAWCLVAILLWRTLATILLLRILRALTSILLRILRVLTSILLRVLRAILILPLVPLVRWSLVPLLVT